MVSKENYSCGLNSFSLVEFIVPKLDYLSQIFVQLLSGIIQGSVIGPIMFIIFINELVDLLARFGITVKFFADNAKRIQILSILLMV